MKRSFALVLPVLAALLAGCGSSAKSSSGTTGAAATATGSAAATATGSAAAATTGATTSAAPAPGASGGETIATKPSKLGTVLAAGPKKLTVYLFEADASGHSACSGACAQTWPPVTTSGAPQAGSGAMSADLGTVARPDGTTQVTYKGHPLYLYARDKDSGDAYGEGLNSYGAGWYVLRPDGTKIDKS